MTVEIKHDLVATIYLINSFEIELIHFLSPFGCKLSAQWPLHSVKSAHIVYPERESLQDTHSHRTGADTSSFRCIIVAEV
jgi:hypothetical protein